MEKLLSIIIPTYNMEKYLRICLNSLVGISNLNLLEIIVVNDGSKDSSSQIAHEYENLYPGIIIVIDKKNGNYGSCINSALKIITGKYVKILDSDDSFYTENFSGLLNVLSEIDVDLVLNDYVKEFTSGKRIEYKYNLPNNKILQFKEIYDTEALYNILMPAITYRTNILKESGYRQTEGIPYTDTEWCFSPMIKVSTIFYYNEFVYRYLMGRDGQTMDPQIYKRSIPYRMECFRSMLKSINGLRLSHHIKEFTSKQLIKHAIYIYNYYLIDNVSADRSALYEFDEEFKLLNKYAYNKCDSIRYRLHIPYCHIKDWRIRKYKNIPCSVRVIKKILDTLGSLRLKLFVKGNPNEER